MAIAAALQSQSKALANLSIHSQRLSRQFERTAAQLRALQEARRAREKDDLDDVLDIQEMYASTGKDYDASADGFVFSPAEIDDRIRARRRRRLTSDALDYRYSSASA